MGPSTEDEDVLRELIKNGMNVARFNFSHGSHEYHAAGIARVRKVSKELGIPVAIALDTKGPEIRTRNLENGQPVMLNTDDEVVVTTDDIVGNAQRFSLDYLNLPNEVEKGSIILLDDGLIGLEVESVDGSDMHCVVTNGGMLGEHKGVNVPNVDVGLPAVTNQDKADIVFGCEQGIDAIFASFIRDAAAVREIRELCAQCECDRISIYPKIECALGVKNFDEILEAASGIMVARGDLGVEVPSQKVPHLQKQMIRKCNEAYKPVITATQMLDSMIRNPRPTRAEVTDVANAVYDGTDCVMLSGETAAGKYPVEAVKTMASVCKETEHYLIERTSYHDRGGVRNVNGAIGFAAVTTAERVDAKCILAPTNSGRTARLISNFRPKLPLIAFSPSETTIRKCCFYWGVEAYPSVFQASLNATIKHALDLAKEHKCADSGDMVVVTAGDPGTSPRQGDYTTSTNMVMVAQIS
ncbi:MAG: pyruvate kinase [Atopobiaceae bacterium]|jgi:pyruvate kinase|nr:pyruvate kinase [Atopobiaceae bacterium]